MTISSRPSLEWAMTECMCRRGSLSCLPGAGHNIMTMHIVCCWHVFRLSTVVCALTNLVISVLCSAVCSMLFAQPSDMQAYQRYGEARREYVVTKPCSKCTSISIRVQKMSASPLRTNILHAFILTYRRWRKVSTANKILAVSLQPLFYMFIVMTHRGRNKCGPGRSR